MGCFGECWDAGPPPDSILFIPPPPVPVFLQQSLPDLLLNSTPCSSSHPCEAWVHHMQGGNTATSSDGNSDYIELPRKDLDANWAVSSIDDTWLLVLVASAIGVLLLGALLAMFLLKCRELNIFGSSECSIIHSGHHRTTKNHEPRDCSAINGLCTNKANHHPPPEAVLYSGPPNMQDNRMVWAALTPRGTQHFISDNYPRNLIDYTDNEDHYETIDNLHHSNPTVYNTHQKGLPLKLSKENVGYSGYGDYNYEEPTPLIESYRLNDIENREENPYYSTLGNTDMRCASLGSTYRRGTSMNLPIRPRVSSPTRIENPNLPPLNLNPNKGVVSANGLLTLKKHNMTYKRSDSVPYNDNLLPKYGC